MRTPSFPTFFIPLLLFGISGAEAQTRSWSSRLHVSWVGDNNVYETVSGPRSDQMGRLLFETSVQCPVGSRIRFFLEYSLGGEVYVEQNDENRLVNDGRALFRFALNRRLDLDLDLEIRDKSFFEISRGYLWTMASASLRQTVAAGWRIGIFAQYSFMDDKQGRGFDSANPAAGVLLEAVPSPAFRGSVAVKTGLMEFERHAFRYEQMDSYIFQWIDLGKSQVDRFWEGTIQAEWYGWALLRIGASYCRNVSNSYGYAYEVPEIHLLGAKTLPWRMTVRVFAGLQWKTYTDPLQPFLQIRPDTEIEENNTLVIDLSRDFDNGWAIVFRSAWYQNESPFRNSYYKKRTLGVGITKRF